MKTSEEMVKSLFERRERYLESNKSPKKSDRSFKAASIIGRIAVPVCGIAVIAGLLAALKGITDNDVLADLNELADLDESIGTASADYDFLSYISLDSLNAADIKKAISEDVLFALAEKAEEDDLTVSDISKYRYVDIGDGTFVVLLRYNDGSYNYYLKIIFEGKNDDSKAVSACLIKRMEMGQLYLDFLNSASRLEDFINGNYKDGADIYTLKTDPYGNISDTAENVLEYYHNEFANNNMYQLYGYSGNNEMQYYVICRIWNREEEAYEGGIYSRSEDSPDISGCVITAVDGAFFTVDGYPDKLATIYNGGFIFYDKVFPALDLYIDGISYTILRQYTDSDPYEMSELAFESSDGSKVYHVYDKLEDEISDSIFVIDSPYISQECPDTLWLFYINS